ncbi:MAG: hypothetical protein WBO36_04580 [Saprospiraceae bacterium]
MKPYFIILIFLSSSFSTKLLAQNKVNFLETNIILSQPQGFFYRNVPRAKVGFELGYLRQLKSQTPLFWGLGIYYHQIGHQGATITELLDFNLVNFDYSTTSNLLGFHGKLRFYPDIHIGKLDFFVEALMGYKWLFTSTTKAFSDDPDSSDFAIEKGNLSLSYGAAAGVNYPVNDKIYINFRANYIAGLSSQYYALNPDNDIRFTTLDQFDLKKSTTDIIRWDLGVTIKFSRID